MENSHIVMWKNIKDTITTRALEKLRMLADWQIEELGFDVASVNEACQKTDEEKTKRELNYLLIKEEK